MGNIEILSVLVTPKIFKQPFNSDREINFFFEYYKELFELFDLLIIIFAVGNGEHILLYRGSKFLQDEVKWARYNSYINLKERKVISNFKLTYALIKEIIKKFKSKYRNLRVFDTLDPGPEFCESEFREKRHPEVMWWDDIRNVHHRFFDWCWVDVSAVLKKDTFTYSSFPQGIPEGIRFSDFLTSQLQDYLKDMDLDGIFLQNAYGTLGQWEPRYAKGWGEGFNSVRAKYILHFFQSLKQKLGKKEIFWWDTYWPKEYEYGAWSVPEEAYHYMDYLLLANHAVIIPPEIAKRNLESKLNLKHPKLILSIDLVDPWYEYKTYEKYPYHFTGTLKILKEFKSKIDGIQIWLNDAWGNFVPREVLLKVFQAVGREV